jgi:hypothetical protein
MKGLFEKINEIYRKNQKEIIKHHWMQTLDSLHAERAKAVDHLSTINKEIYKTELVVFGN